MTDSRLKKLAQILVTGSIEVQPMEKVEIRLTDAVGLPLAIEVYKQVVKVGGLPSLDIGVESLSAWFYRNANSDQLKAFPKVAEFKAKHADKFVTIVADVNKREMSGVDPKVVLERSKITQPIKEVILKKRWVLTYYPTPAMAQDANMDLEQFEDFFFNSTNRDWTQVEAQMHRVAQVMDNAQEIEVKGEDTHLLLSARGRKFIYDDWKANMPGGEVFTAPVDDATEGYIYFNYPLLRQGKLIRDIRLEFEKGRVVKATASEHQAYLNQILDTDEGARILGEFAIGGNPGIQRYMYNVLFDEKMYGTIHMAVGSAYEECRGVNKSAIHMDMIKDMRTPGSQVIADGKVILDEGKIVV